MELMAQLSILFVLALVTLSAMLSAAALVLSMWNTIHIQAQRLSTHTVIPVTPESTMTKIEEQLSNIARGAGGDQADLNRNLFQSGLDPDDLV